MDNEDVNVAALSVLDGNAGSTGDNIQGYVILGIELLLDQVKESGIMQTGSSCQLEPFAFRCICTAAKNSQCQEQQGYLDHFSRHTYHAG